MLSNCAQCRYFNHHPNYSGDIRCAVAPAYAAMWQKLKSLDESTLNAIPVDSCLDFELNPSLEKKEIDLSLTFQQWQKLIRDYDCPESILNALKDKLFEHSLLLTLGDWKAIANSSQDPDVLETLAQQSIEPDEKEEGWIEVDSSCIEAIAFNRSQSCLYIQFHSQSVYQYRQVSSDIFEEFLNADSKGRFFNLHIKDQFPYSLYA